MQMPTNRWVFALQATVAILMGAIFICERVETIRVGVVLSGLCLLVISVLALLKTFIVHFGLSILLFFNGIFGALAVILAFRHPVLATLGVPTILAIVLGAHGLIMGALDIINARQGNPTGSFVLATLNIAIGLLLFGTSAAAVMIRSDVFGILLLVQGIAFMFWAFRVNDQT
jgi:uncharacterized membrane protein HdeD (DUF308 family)